LPKIISNLLAHMTYVEKKIKISTIFNF